MALYRYVKAPPAIAYRRTGPKIASFSLMGLGLALLLWVGWPILTFSAISDQVFSNIISPIGDQKNIIRTTAPQIAHAASPTENILTQSGSDFTNVNAWYPSVPQKHITPQVTTYTLSIPKVRVKDALVTISGDDLFESLIHYGGTGIPGQYGGPVIFGHSTLPQFYDPKNYRTIFSLLPTLKKGDDIYVNYDGVDYRYTIYDMVVKEPSDLSVLEQRYDDSYLSLITCVPPGTTWRRLHVMAKLNSL